MDNGNQLKGCAVWDAVLQEAEFAGIDMEYNSGTDKLRVSNSENLPLVRVRRECIACVLNRTTSKILEEKMNVYHFLCTPKE